MTPNDDVGPLNVTSEIATEFFGNVSVTRNKETGGVLQLRKQLSYQQVAGYKLQYIAQEIERRYLTGYEKYTKDKEQVSSKLMRCPFKRGKGR